MSSKTFKYAIKRGNKSYGIRNIELLKNLARERKIFPQDNIYYYSENKWLKAGQISALAKTFAFQTDGYSLNKSTMTEDMTVTELSRSQVKKHLSPTSPPKTVREVSLPRTPIEQQTTEDSKFDMKTLFDEFNEEPPTGNTRSDMIYQRISSDQPKPATEPEEATEIPLKNRISASVYIMAVLVLLVFATGAFMLGKYLSEDNDFYARLEASRADEDSLPIRTITD